MATVAQPTDTNPLVSETTLAAFGGMPKHNRSATAAPGVSNDSSDGEDYKIGSTWWDVENKNVYDCLSAAIGAASWKIRSNT